MRRSPVAKRGKGGEIQRSGRRGERGGRGGRGGKRPKKRNEEEFDGEERDWPPPPLQGCPSKGRW